MGREPVTVNGVAVLSPQELATGDKIEVVLENRTRVLHFFGEDETVQIRAPVRQPLADANAAPAKTPAAAMPAPAARCPAPPPPPPPPPPAAAAAAPASVPAALGGMAAELQNAIKAGVQLKKVQPESRPAAPAPPQAGGPFVPNPADLMKLKAGLRKTAPAPEEEAAVEQPEAKPMEQLAKQQPAEQPAEPAAAEQPLDHPAAEAAAEPAAEAAVEAAQPVEQPAAGPGAEQHGEAAADGSAPMEAEAAEAVSQEVAVAEEEPAAEQEAMAAEPADAAMAGASAADEQLLAELPPTQPATELPATQPASELPATQPAEEAAADEQPPAADAPTSALRKRKSVRFHVEETEAVAGTPEGAAHDATITIRLRKGDLEQIINVDDNTVAFAHWGLGTMGCGASDPEELPDTVVSKKSRRSTVLASAGKTPVPSALRELLAAASPATSTGAQATPGAMGPQAPAPTPVTGGRLPAAGEVGLAVNAATLAAKLAEMAEEHDVTLEVPAEFFKSPAPGKDCLRVVLTPKSKSTTPAPGASAVGAGLASAAHGSPAKSVPRTTGRSRLSQVSAAEQPTPGVAPSASAHVVAVPEEADADAEAAAPGSAVQASAKKRLSTASRRRSLLRTPGTKIVIVERATPGSAAKRTPAGKAGSETPQRLLSTIGLHAEADDCGDGVEQERSGEAVLSDDGSLAEAAAVAAAQEVVPLKQYQRAVLKAKRYHGEAHQLGAQLRRMTAKAFKLKRAAEALSAALEEERGKRAELQDALQQVVLNRAAAEAEAEQAAATEQQEAEMVDAAAQAGGEEPAEEEPAEEAEQEAVAPLWQTRVVVLGRLHKGVSTAEQAGDVVVVRPSHLVAAAAAHQHPVAPAPEVVVLPASARKTPAPPRKTPARTPAPSAFKARTPATAAAAQGKTPAPSAAKSARKSLAGAAPELPKSMLKEAAGDDAPTVVLENVELPGWLFEGEQAAPEVAAAAAVAAQEAVPTTEEQQAAAKQAAAEAAAAEQQDESLDAVLAQEAAEGVAGEAEAAAEMQVDGAADEAAQEALQEAASQRQQPQPQAEAEGSDGEEEDEGEDEEDYCHLCGQSDEGDVLLLCDSCDNACHLSCCNPPLKRVPKGDWFCVECSAKQAAEAAAAAKAKPVAKRGGKRSAAAAEPEAAPAEEPAKPAGHGRRAAAAPAEQAPPAKQAAPAKAGRGRSKRAAEEEPAVEEDEEAATAGRSKRGRAAAPKASEEPAPSARARGRATASKAAAGKAEAEEPEVSTRRGRGAAAPKPEAAPARSTRSRR
ncbi:Bromodomain adjacent to zinc finger domain 2A [Micractinium conductrix]|uniref:Bromodomain adjacent to zinc finger domain 2A n=1 Tax=Micractinium conductrix TaxID=554055 RepID=A0A2P6V9E3_9CHLO|nr:Bromodomain adjacent to zinc finger domain 2A [Micractinium conductrix]|eukprot:PSC70702.1 Bromodomain adjacent to zinc finger domain 2A [Micractinium conductrix]